jgi:hypothetical protein
MILFIILFVLVGFIVASHTEDERMVRLKERYYSFIPTLPEKYNVLKKPVCITGLYGAKNIGTNVNKGSEIFVCIEGEDVNNFFHILLHELAHSTVKEYDHSDKFWENYAEIRDIAQKNGFYEPIVNKSYCGKTISDS